jgi:RNA polymerase sigma-70 factor (ECF subfamily)
VDHAAAAGRAGPGVAMSEPRAQTSAATFVEDLFARHHGEIYAYLVRMLRDEELAADLAQDAFLKAYRAYDQLGPPDSPRAWLYRIAHRVALDELRRRRIIRFLPWTGESSGAAPSAERVAMDVRLSGPLAQALARIPERQRSALLLAELHDLTGLELAAALGVSHVAARALLTRARESLRRALAEAEATDAARIAGPGGGPTTRGPSTSDAPAGSQRSLRSGRR